MPLKLGKGSGAPLRDCYIYVDAKNERGESLSAGVRDKVLSLGGSIHEECQFSRNRNGHGTTHVVVTANCTSRSVCETAVSLGIPVVNPAWVKACLQAKQRLDVDEFCLSRAQVSRIGSTMKVAKSKTPLNAKTYSKSVENQVNAGAIRSSSSSSSKGQHKDGGKRNREVDNEGSDGKSNRSTSSGPKISRGATSFKTVLQEGNAEGGSDNEDDDDDADGYPKWFSKSVIGSSSNMVSNSRLQDKKSDEFLVTEEEIPLPGYEMYFSEHYPNPNAKCSCSGDEGEKKQKLLSPSRTNRRSERISDQLPLSQDPGWLQEEDFDALRPDESSEEPYVMPELAYKENYAGDTVENCSNCSGSQGSSKSKSKSDMKGKGSPAKSPASRSGKDSESFDDGEKSTFDVIGTRINEDTVIMMWGPEDFRKVDSSMCKTVLAYRAKESEEKMKSVAYQSSQEPSIDISNFAYPMLPEQEDGDDDHYDDTCDQNITPASAAAMSPSTVPTVLTTGGRRSSMKLSLAKSSSSSSSSTSSESRLNGHDNIEALMNVTVPSPRRETRASGRPSPRIRGGGGPSTRNARAASQRSSEVASAMLGLREHVPACQLPCQDDKDDDDYDESDEDPQPKIRDSSSSKKRSPTRLFDTSPSIGRAPKSSSTSSLSNEAVPGDEMQLRAGAEGGTSSPQYVAPSRLIIPPMDTSEPIVVATTAFRDSADEDLPGYLQQICDVYGKGVYGKPRQSSGKSTSYDCDGRSKPRVDVTCVGSDLGGDKDYEGNFATDLLVAPSNGSKRTIRILFALARGVPIVTENWVHDCIERKYFSEWYAFRVERYKHLKLFIPSNILARTRIFIGGHDRVSDEMPKKLCETIGGTIVDDFCISNLALFGDPKDYYHWVKSRTVHFQNLAEQKVITERKMQESIRAERTHAANMIERRQLCLFKIIPDSLEAGKIIDPEDRKDDHLVVPNPTAKVSHSKGSSKSISRPLPSALSKCSSSRAGKSGTSDGANKATSAGNYSNSSSLTTSAKVRQEAGITGHRSITPKRYSSMPNTGVENSGVRSSSVRRSMIAVKVSNPVQNRPPLGTNSSTGTIQKKGGEKRKDPEQGRSSLATKQARPTAKPRGVAPRRSSRTCSGKPCGNGYTCVKHRTSMVLEYVPPDPEDTGMRRGGASVVRDAQDGDDGDETEVIDAVVEEEGDEDSEGDEEAEEESGRDWHSAKSTPTKIIGGMIEGAVGAVSGLMKSLSQQSQSLGTSPVF